MHPRLIATRLMLAFALSGAMTGCAPELGNPWFLALPDVPGDPDATAWPSDQPIGLRHDAGSERDGQLEADAVDASTPEDGRSAPADSPDGRTQDVGPEDAAHAEDAPSLPEDRPQPTDAVDAGHPADAPAAPDVVAAQDAGGPDGAADGSPDVPADTGVDVAADVPSVLVDAGSDAGTEDRPQADVVDVPVSCASGTEHCGATCFDLRTSLENCGVCGRACGAGEVCTEGRCHDIPCGTAQGWYLCSGTCVDVSRNDAHCGRCGSPCGAGFHCRMGLCGG